MVYSNKFIAVVVCNNQIVREIRENGNDQVYLPFGSDYSLRFKNQYSTKAVVNVEIDGKDVLDGDQLVIDGNSTSELKGFMINGKVNNAFRFIEKTQQIAKHRGDFIDDGFIRITWKFEKQFNDCWINSTPFFSQKICKDYPLIGSSAVYTSQSCNTDYDTECFTRGNLTDFNKTNEGITVAGKDTHQNFQTVSVGQLEDTEYSIVIHLLGKDDKNRKISRPKITRVKIQCPTCGTKSKSYIKFCPNCGTNIKAVV